MRIINYLIIFFAFLVIYSCHNKSEKKHCKKQAVKISDTIFKETEILSSLTYDRNCKINHLDLLVLLDERSNILDSTEYFKDITLKLGFIPDTSSSFVLSKKDYVIIPSKGNKLLKISYEFIKPYLDTLNVIDVQTITYNALKKRTLKSESYFYNNSKKILGIENTYLDFSAFKEKNVAYKNISNTSKIAIDSILVTVKTAKFIDELTKYNIEINDTLSLNFRHSIKANYKKNKYQENNVTMYNVLKMNKNFVTFKLDLSNLNLNTIHSLKVFLD